MRKACFTSLLGLLVASYPYITKAIIGGYLQPRIKKLLNNEAKTGLSNPF